MLKISNISKSFGSVKALGNVSFQIEKGEIHALCGENGAGKSTLMNIIVGNLKADEGGILLDNTPLSISSNLEAKEHGISIVYQERSLVDSLNVAENIYPNPPTKSFGRIDFKNLYKNAQDLLNQLKINDLSPKTALANLSPAQKQLVEIAKALATNPTILILDEPTASLSDRETAILFGIIKNLKNAGKTVIYISHRMAEIKAIADRVSVLKDGQYQGTLEAGTASTDDIIRLMVGRELLQKEYTSHAQNTTVLEVKDLSGQGFDAINFQLKKGEILGFGGLVGAGRTELAKAIFGANPIKNGNIFISAPLSISTKNLTISSPRAAISNGIAYVPEERKAQGIFPDLSVLDNISVALIGSITKNKILNIKYLGKNSEHFIQKINIKTPSVSTPIKDLSGGNQQKVILARWLSTQSDILIVDEPTHGVDVGAKAEIYDILKSLTTEGKSIILISSELPELLLLSDRIAVMRAGRLTAILDKKEATEEKIMALAAYE
jgi:ribose transport system ATP-binding protein